MKTKLLNFILTLLFLFSGLLRLVKSEEVESVVASSDLSVDISPPFIQQVFDSKDQEAFSQVFEFTLRNFESPSYEIGLFESDYSFQNFKDSPTLKAIFSEKGDVSASKIVIDTKFDIKSLEDKTYFFVLKIILYSNSSSGELKNQVEVNIPCLLTVSKDPGSANPKPDFALDPSRKVYFNSDGITVKTQILNQSDKLIDFGGEVIVFDSSNTILYSESINTDNNSILPPKTSKLKELKDVSLPKRGFLPYFGKVNLAIRGTVNGQRHIETEKISIIIIPYQLILITIAFIMVTTYIITLIMRKNRRRL